MHYEEQVIDGVLSWRGELDGEWTPCTAAELTERLMVITAKFDEWREGWTIDARRMMLIARIAEQQGTAWDERLPNPYLMSAEPRPCPPRRLTRTTLTPRQKVLLSIMGDLWLPGKVGR